MQKKKRKGGGEASSALQRLTNFQAFLINDVPSFESHGEPKLFYSLHLSHPTTTFSPSY